MPSSHYMSLRSSFLTYVNARDEVKCSFQPLHLESAISVLQLDYTSAAGSSLCRNESLRILRRIPEVNLECPSSCFLNFLKLGTLTGTDIWKTAEGLPFSFSFSFSSITHFDDHESSMLLLMISIHVAHIFHPRRHLSLRLQIPAAPNA